MNRTLIALFLITSTLLSSASLAGSTQVNTLLARVKGSVGYLDDAVTPMKPIVSTLVLPDSAFAVTKAASAGIITMPDSSEITLGELTKVRVGAFKTASAGPGSTITIDHGALQFAIKHPAGGKSNYTFATTTSQIAVRGTDGYVASNDDEDVVAVTHASSSNDVSVRAGGKTYNVPAGHTLHVKKRKGRVQTASLVTGTSHSSFSQFSSLHHAAAGAAAAGAAAAAAGAAVHAQTTSKKKKHH